MGQIAGADLILARDDQLAEGLNARRKPRVDGGGRVCHDRDGNTGGGATGGGVLGGVGHAYTIDTPQKILRAHERNLYLVINTKEFCAKFDQAAASEAISDRESRSRRVASPWIWQTRDSVTPRTAPISFRFRLSQ